MNKNVAKAKELLNRNNYTCVLVDGDTVYTDNRRGVTPLLEWLKEGTDLSGFSAADKVVGKAAAFLYVLMGVKAVYAHVISKHALAVFEEQKIEVQFRTLVDAIHNRTNTGSCPMEMAVMDITDPKKAVAIIQNTLQILSRNHKPQE